ncbi:unnamed protein product, partial [Ectocarpus sp. 12 AP-2014]
DVQVDGLLHVEPHELVDLRVARADGQAEEPDQRRERNRPQGQQHRGQRLRPRRLLRERTEQVGGEHHAVRQRKHVRQRGQRLVGGSGRAVVDIAGRHHHRPRVRPHLVVHL